MARLFTRKNIIIGILVHSCIVGFLAFFATRSIYNAVTQARKEDRSLQSLRILESIMDDMQDMESSHRGFVISGDSLFLPPYYSSLAQLQLDTNELKSELLIYPDRNKAYQDLLNLLHVKVNLAGQTIGLMKEGRMDDTNQRILTGRGRAVMDSIRMLISRFELSDREILANSNTQRKRNARFGVQMLIITSCVLLIGLVWFAWKLLQEERIRTKYESQVAYLAGLAEQTSDAIFSTNKEGIVVAWNKGAENMMGYKASEAIGKFASTITRSQRTAAETQSISKELSDTGKAVRESIIYHKDGREIFCLGSVTVLNNENGEVSGLVMVLRDITDRRLNERLLAKFNKELAEQVEEKTSLIQSMVERIKDGFYSLNNNREITFINEYAARMMGYTPEEITGKNLWEAYPGAIDSPAYKLIEEAFTKQIHRQLQFYYPPLDKWFEATVYPSATGVSLYFKDITEQKTAEERMKRSNERFDLISRTTNDAIWEWDLVTGKMWGNEMHQQLYGLKDKDPVPDEKEWELRIHPQDKEKLLQRQEAALASRDNIFITEYRFRTARGYRHINDRCYIVRDREGKAIRMMGSMMDITDQKEAAEKIRISEGQYRVLVENAVEALVVLDAHTQQFLMVSQSAETLFKMSREDLLKEGPVTMSPECQPNGMPSAEAAREVIEAAVAGGKPVFEWTHLDANGQPVLCEITLVRLPSEDRVLIRGSIVDITERKKAEIALKESEEKIRHILSSSVDEFYVIDRQLRVTLINEVAKRNLQELFGVVVENGTYILDIFPEDRMEFFKKNYERMFSGERIEYEFMNEFNGKSFWRRVSYSPVSDKEGLITAGFISTTDVTERKKAEEDIMKTNARFQIVSKATSDIVWDLNLIEETLWWNDNYFSSLGYPKRKELMPLNEWERNIHPEDRERVSKKFNKALESADTSWRDEYRYRKADGNYLHMLDRGYILRNESGNAYRMIGSLVDMTPVYQAQKKIIESEYRLRTILDTNPECIKLMDGECNLIDINNAGLQMVEADHFEDVAGKSLLAVVAEAQRKEASRLVAEAYLGHHSRFEFEMITLKGKRRWCEVNLVPFRNAEGHIISVLGVTRDMSESREARDALIKNEEKYRTLVEQAADAIALYDAMGNILDVNTGAARLLGYTKEELMQMRLDQILTKDETLRNPVRYDVLQAGKSTVKQRKMRRKDGVIVETEVRSQQLPDGRFLSVIRDLTERIKAEQELQHYFNQLKELNSYLQNVREEERSNIAREIHDELGQQLTVLKMDISWVNKKIGEQSPELKERLKGLIEMVDNTVKSVRRISSELRPSLLDDLGLPAAMEWHAQEFMKRTGIQIDTNIDSFELKLPGKVAITLFRVFQESLTNVARHAEANCVEVRLELQQDPEAILLTVKDDGKGFLMKDIESRKTLGILGMKERIDIINGEYDIQSSPGKGTLVSVKVPLQA